MEPEPPRGTGVLMMVTGRGGVAAILGAALAAGAVWQIPEAQARESTGQRLDRIERLLDSQSLVQLMTQLDELQKEVQSLRGSVEQQGHSLAQMRKRQRDLYVDIDRRLRQIEAGAAPAAQSMAPSPAPAAPTAPGAATPAPAVIAATGPAAASPAPAMDGPQAQADYQKAFKLLKEGRYESAIKSFDQFIAAWPGSGYADNAQYWMAEAYYVTRKFEPAITEFNRLVERYPESQKLTHALLKIGYIHHEMGDRTRARQVLGQLRSQHPGTTAARLAEERLQRMRMEEQR